MGRSRPLARFVRVVLVTLWIVVLPVLAMVLLEGASSLVLFVHQIRPGAERIHTEYDSLLGWVNQVNAYIPDMYGPGVSLRTNAQRFRSKRPATVHVPSGRVRVICSGDSFTLGYGVDDDHTWCERLTARNSALETVNMGQGGYGIDQAYLWYKRDGVKVEHDVHLFAIIEDDFRRMQGRTFNGYGKPVLAIRNEMLTTENVPVPYRPVYAPWLTRSAEALGELRASDLIRRIKKRLQTAQTTDRRVVDSLTWKVAAKVFSDLDSVNRARHGVLVLVFLPTEGDRENASRKWRRRVREFSEREQIALVDLIDDFSQLPADSMDRLFIRAGEIEFAGAAGHYTTLGNEWVATRLYQNLLALPEVARRLPQPFSPEARARP